MHELIPLAAGAVVGLLVAQIASARLRVALFAALSVAVGALVSFLMGEAATALAPLFLGFDALLVWLGGLAAIFAATWWRARGVGQVARR